MYVNRIHIYVFNKSRSLVCKLASQTITSLGSSVFSQYSALYFTLMLDICIKVKLATVDEGDQKAPFLMATTPRCRGGHYSFPFIASLYP